MTHLLTYLRSLFTKNLKNAELSGHSLQNKNAPHFLLILFDFSSSYYTIDDCQILNLDFPFKLLDKHFHLIAPQAP